MNNFSYLSSLFTRLKQEYQTFNNLLLNINNLSSKKIYQSSERIKQLIKLFKEELEKIKNDYKTSIMLNRERRRRDLYNNQLGQIQKLIYKSLNTLSFNIPFLNKYSTDKITPKDLVNLSFRINKQDKYPLNLQTNQSFPAAFLRAFPHEDLEIKNSVLKFDLSEEKRLLPPIVTPREGIVKKGTLLTITYKNDKEKDKHEIFFKFSTNPDCIPSFFSGELYNENSPIILDEDCIVKVCACKSGFKDSIIITNRYQVTTEERENAEKIMLAENENQNFVVRPELEIAQNGEKYTKINVNADDINSPIASSGSGSAYRASFLDKGMSDESEEDEI